MSKSIPRPYGFNPYEDVVKFDVEDVALARLRSALHSAEDTLKEAQDARTEAMEALSSYIDARDGCTCTSKPDGRLYCPVHPNFF